MEKHNEKSIGLKAPTINLASVVTGLDRYLAEKGADPKPVFAQVDLDVADIEQPDARVPLVSYLELLEKCADSLDDPLFGLRFGAQYDPRHAGVAGNVALASLNVGTALAMVARYLPTIVDSAVYGLEVEDATAFAYTYYYDPILMSYQQKADWTVSFCCNIIRRGLGQPDWKPDEVIFHALPDEPPAVRHERIKLVGPNLRSGHAWTGIRFDAELLEAPMQTADATMNRLMMHYGDLRLSSLASGTDELEPLRRETARLLIQGKQGIDHLAKSSGVSVRTLQRRLGVANVSYSDLLANVRQTLALNLLEKDGPALTEIAFSLGYSDVSAFNHAFRRWTGVSPGQYRSSR